MRIAKKNGLIKVTCFHPNKVSLCLVEIGWSLAKHNNCLNQLHLPDVEQVVVLQVEHSQLWQINHQVAHLPQVILGKIQMMQMGQIDVILLYFLKASFKQNLLLLSATPGIPPKTKGYIPTFRAFFYNAIL